MLEDLDIKTLEAPFPADVIGIKVQSFTKDRTKAMLVAYLQHTDVYRRLEEVDPSWASSCTQLEQVINKEVPAGKDSFFLAKVAITLKGITRENVGEGDEPKGALSDALKRAAMLFGVGRYLYDSETVWVPYNEATDKYKVWSLSDYEKYRKKGQALPVQSSLEKNDTHYFKENTEAFSILQTKRNIAKNLVKKIQDLAPERDLDGTLVFLTGSDEAKFSHIDKIKEGSIDKLEKIIITAEGWLKANSLVKGGMSKE